MEEAVLHVLSMPVYSFFPFFRSLVKAFVRMYRNRALDRLFTLSFVLAILASMKSNGQHGSIPLQRMQYHPTCILNMADPLL